MYCVLCSVVGPYLSGIPSTGCRKIHRIHLFRYDVLTLIVNESYHTDDENWGWKLLGKCTKYGPLLQLLEKHRLGAKLHVLVIGRACTIYKHNRQVLEQLGLDRNEATQALGEVHDLTISYAHTMYQLYGQLRQENHCARGHYDVYSEYCF